MQRMADDIAQSSKLHSNRLAPSATTRSTNWRDILIKPNPIDLSANKSIESFVQNNVKPLTESNKPALDPTSPETTDEEPSRVLDLRYTSTGQLTSITLDEDDDFDPDQIAEVFRDPENYEVSTP